MAEATKVNLSDDDRAKIKRERSKLDLTQASAAELAWPGAKGGKITWARIETDRVRCFDVEQTLLPVLNVLGLEFSTLKIRKVPVK